MNTMSLTEKHHAEDPHRAIPAAPPDHQGTDGGAAGGRGRWGDPPEGVSGEAAQVGLQVGRQGGVRVREIQPWRSDDQQRAHRAGGQH